ncbi:MAG: DNA invertase Pin-like site-specific DNA recombinase [Pirellulaceae bacterium]|jgi:DNA invertase Pin-like site-specific DNA recombinase
MMTESRNLIAYFRVSTKKQERSGLGLEGQREAVTNFANGQVLAEYTETETGKRADRPELKRAIAHAKRADATLCIAKLDRLARNVHFVSGLMESGIEFVACDMPQANQFTIHILAAVAEHEAAQISERTKAALAAAKRRGVKLGASRVECRNLTDEARHRGAMAAGQVVREQADEAYADLYDFLQSLRPSFSYQQIAEILNLRGERTRRGKPWSDVAVMRVCRRM